jgi:hypothetical protein
MKIWQLATVTGLAWVTAFAQTQTAPKYIQIDYMKVENGQQYIKMEQDFWKAVHKAQIDNKNIESWAVYGVHYPWGTNREYDFTTATVFSNFAALESPYKGIEIEKIHPHITRQEFGQRTSSARKLIRSDVFYTMERAGTPTSWKYLEMQYMKAEPGKGGEYVKAVRELWKPIHEDRVKNGLILGWGIAGLRYPAGANREYDFVTGRLLPWHRLLQAKCGKRTVCCDSETCSRRGLDAYR